MVTIAFLGGFLVLQKKNIESVILYWYVALGTPRLLPALQQIYSGWAILKGQTASMSLVRNAG